MAEESRSPLKSKPLRTPGQSCEERRHQIYESKLEAPVVMAAGMTVIALYEFVSWRFGLPREPVAFAVTAFGALAFLALRVRRYVPEIRQLKLAADGEKAVGQFLERLRTEGYDVFHDVPADGFNVDHVVVGPTGVYSIETKTWRKPRRGKAQVNFDGERLDVNGYIPDRDPVSQARAQASWLAREIEASTGRRIPVRPVILFPGWWIESPEGAMRDIWVLEPKALPKFLERQSTRLDQEELRLVAYHLSRYIRTFSEARPA